MKDLVIGDIHFGIKTNSPVWLEHQVNFFKKQIFPIIKKNNYDRVVFLGDVFDIRYSINTQVGIKVKNLIRYMSKIFNKVEFYFIAGNHDYYCPQIEFESDNAYNLLFGEEFEFAHKNIHFITENYIRIDDTLFLPWYWTENEERWNEVINKESSAKLIYCHSDLEHWEQYKIDSKGDITVISGHIHYPWVDVKNKLYNVGACDALTFNDVNSPRYIYTVIDGVIIEKFENVTTPKFRQFYNEEIFTVSETDFDNSFVRLYINSANINKARYIEQIKYLKSSYMNSNIKVNVIDDNIINSTQGVNLSTNIDTYIEENIPEHLLEKYEIIKDKLA